MRQTEAVQPNRAFSPPPPSPLSPRMTMDDDRASFVLDDLLASDGEGAPLASPEFPDGLRVLLVDDDPTCLKILERMLRTCLYEVTTCSRALAALTVLRERKGGFDLVIINVYMPDIDGFKLLELIGSEMNLPVIMMSADDGKDVVMKGVTHGACDYLIKPVRMEALKTIWQHVVRKRRNELNEMENSGSVAEGDEKKRALDDGDTASSVNDVNSENIKKRKEGKEEEGEIKEREDSLTGKKPRVVWGNELHEKFVSAVEQLTVEKAVPKKILELMNIPELTRENVASHLQKYRLHLRRGGPSKHQGSFNTDFSGARRDMNTATGVTAIDQIGFGNSDVQFTDPSRMRSASGQQLNTNQMNLLCGPSTSMDSMQLSQSQQAAQLYGNMGQQVSEGIPGFVNLPSSIKANSSFAGGIINGNLADPFVVQTTQQGQQFSFSQQQNHTHIDMQYQPQLNRYLLNAPADKHNSTLSSTIGQQILSSGISGHMSGSGGINGNTSLAGNYMSASSYGAVPQAQFPEFRNSYMTESAGNCYPLASSMEASNHTLIGMFQDAVPTTGSLEASSNATSLKGVKDSIPSHGRFGGLHQSKSQDWRSQNINLSYESAQHLGFKQNNIKFGSSNSTDGNSRNTCTVRKEIISVRTEIERKVGVAARHNGRYLVENSVRVKGGGDILFHDNIIPNELMDGFVRQPQEGVGQGEPEFTFDVFPLDEIQASA